MSRCSYLHIYIQGVILCCVRVIVFKRQRIHFKLYHGGNQFIFNDKWRGPLSIRATHLVGFLQFQLSETTVRGYTCCSTRTHYPDSEPTTICSFYLMLRAQSRSNRQQFNSYRTQVEDADHFTTDAVVYNEHW